MESRPKPSLLYFQLSPLYCSMAAQPPLGGGRATMTSPSAKTFKSHRHFASSDHFHFSTALLSPAQLSRRRRTTNSFTLHASHLTLPCAPPNDCAARSHRARSANHSPSDTPSLCRWLRITLKPQVFHHVTRFRLKTTSSVLTVFRSYDDASKPPKRRGLAPLRDISANSVAVLMVCSSLGGDEKEIRLVSRRP